MPPGANAGSAEVIFHVAQEENVAMSVEIKTDLFAKKATDNWAPKGCRQGERADWPERRQPAQDIGEELVFPAITPPVWPRVFPGI
jgi:hypothetical protein